MPISAILVRPENLARQYDVARLENALGVAASQCVEAVVREAVAWRRFSAPAERRAEILGELLAA